MANMASDDIMSSILAGGINAIANKPQKTSSVTNTGTMITPNEYADMLMRRNSIGNSANLLNSLSSAREKPLYNLANSLANYGGQSTPGQIDWASGIRSLGGAFNGVVNAKLANAQQAYDLNRKDLEDALKFDKEMGTRQQQTQTEQIGYNSPQSAQTSVPTSEPETPTSGVDPESFAKKYDTGGYWARKSGNVDEQGNPTFGADLAKNVAPKNQLGAASALSQTMTDEVLSPKIQNMIQNMGGARGADTPKEVILRIGKIADLSNSSTEEQVAAINATKSKMLKSLNVSRRKANLPEMTPEQFQPHWNSLFSGLESFDKQIGDKRLSQPTPSQGGRTPEELDVMLGDL